MVSTSGFTARSRGPGSGGRWPAPGPDRAPSSDGSLTSKPKRTPTATSAGAGSFNNKIRSSTSPSRPEFHQETTDRRSVAGVR